MKARVQCDLSTLQNNKMESKIESRILAVKTLRMTAHKTLLVIST